MGIVECQQVEIQYEKSQYKKNRSENMVFNTGAALLDAIVLAVVSKDIDGTYGYKITPVSYTHLDVYKRQPTPRGLWWKATANITPESRF